MRLFDRRWKPINRVNQTCQTARHADGPEADICSLELLEGSVRGLDKALQRRFIVGIKIAKFDVLKSWEDFWVRLDQVVMAGKWKLE